MGTKTKTGGNLKENERKLRGNVPNLSVVGISSASLDEGSKLAGTFLSPLKGSNF